MVDRYTELGTIRHPVDRHPIISPNPDQASLLSTERLRKNDGFSAIENITGALLDLHGCRIHYEDEEPESGPVFQRVFSVPGLPEEEAEKVAAIVHDRTRRYARTVEPPINLPYFTPYYEEDLPEIEL